jgi:glucokinase
VTAGALGDQPADDQPADDQSAGDQSAGDQSAGDQSAGDRAPGDRCGLVVDIGGTKVLAVLILDGEIVARTRLESRGLAAEVLASDVVSAARQMVQCVGRCLEGALVAVPGTIDREAGVVVSAANLPFCDFPLTSVLSHGLDDVTVILEDDANCGAVGEASAGPAGTMRDLVYITLSTGIGMGSVVGGELVVGAHGYAGELGHVTVVPGGRVCGCGRRGCLEAYASGRAIASLGAELLAANGGTLLATGTAGPDGVTAPAVVAAAERGDAGCLEIIDNANAYIIGAVQMVQLILDPKLVVVGGGLMTSKFFSQRLLGALRGERGFAGGGPTVRTSVFGDDSVIVGGMRLLSAALRRPLSGQIGEAP